MKTLNLGIVAHVDAGKTSLTERLLYAAGVIDTIGRVDDGSTQTDSMALERQRGITIRSAVVSFEIAGTTVNLIDTPGHPDFIAEVERVLGVLDGAVLVVSAVEGVQAQTRVLMRALRRLRIPTLIFVNKIDRGGAQDGALLKGIAAKLSPAIVAMGAVHDIGTRDAGFVPYGDGPDITARLVDLLAAHDDELLSDYVEGGAVPAAELRRHLVRQVGRALVHPVFFGSAIRGAGIEAIVAGIEELLPASVGDPGASVSGTVFKVERGPAGERIAYVRMFDGTLHVRDRLALRDGTEGRVTGIRVFERGAAVRRDSVTAGQIATLRGLDGIRIGDAVGVPPKALAATHHFAPPTLESVVVPASPADRGALHAALTQLAEQDPLIDLRQDDVRQEIFVSLYGEVQKEVVQATLATDFGLAVGFRETTTICVERPVGTGAAFEIMGTPTNPFRATVGLRVEPGPPGSEVDFRIGVEFGSMPAGFFAAVEDTVRETLRQGLYGWNVTDCLVTMTHSGYKPPPCTPGDFRNLTPLILMSALRRATTSVLEPMHRFRIEVPPDTSGPVLSVLARLDAVPSASGVEGSGQVLIGDIPAARVHALEQQLPGLTRGEGLLECAFEDYREVRGPVPQRPRSDHNPLVRKEYLLHVVRRV